MDSTLLKRRHVRMKRALRVRNKIRSSTKEKLRLSVARSNKQIYVQIIDDEQALTLASTSTICKDFRNTEHNRKSKSSAKQLGLKIAELAKKKNIERVVFDRGHLKYHGVIAAVAEGAREGGLIL